MSAFGPFPSPSVWTYLTVFNTGAQEYSHANMVFCNDNRTSYDTRNRVGLWGVVIHIESWAKSSIHDSQSNSISGGVGASVVITKNHVVCKYSRAHMVFNGNPPNTYLCTHGSVKLFLLFITTSALTCLQHCWQLLQPCHVRAINGVPSICSFHTSHTGNP